MEYTVKLCRDSLQSAWGFRLQGGADLKSALTIQRVSISLITAQRPMRLPLQTTIIMNIIMSDIKR